MNAIPANVLVDIASTTVFGAKYVQFVIPPDPSPESLRAGQVLAAKHVMVEINTVFENLTSVLSQDRPAETQRDPGRHRVGRQRRGEKIGQMLTDLDAYLAKIEPSLPALSHDLEVAPAGTAGLRRRRARLRHRRRQCGADQRHDRRPGAEPRRRTGQRDRPGRHRQRRDRRRTGNHSPMSYTCWCRPPIY